jgi:GNAT superfamily N-acetyltransferase
MYHPAAPKEERSMLIERASPGASLEIAEVLRVAFSEFEPLYTPAAFRATTPSAEEIAARFVEGPTWIARDGETVIGTVSAVPRDDAVNLRSMAVRPEARGRGVAGQLLEEVVQFAISHGARRLTLMTTPFLTSAIHLYTVAGFHRLPEPFDLHGTPLFEMSKPLPAERKRTE